MTIYTGTNDHDNLVGTDRNDVFRPLLGQDFVKGGGGLDRIEVDYSSVTAGEYEAYAFSGAGTDDYAIAGSDRFYLDNVQQLVGIGGSSDTSFTFSPANSVAKVTFDAGDGHDTLLVSALANVSISAPTDQVIKIGTSTFTNFETAYINLAGGTNRLTLGSTDDHISTTAGATDVIKTGAGDDFFQAYDSIDNIDGGDGYDRWHGFYTSPNLTFTDYTGKLSNGTTLRNVEEFTLQSSGGGSTFNVRTFHSFLYGSGNQDTTNVNFGTVTGGITVTLWDNDGTFAGSFANGSTSGVPYSYVSSVNVLNYVGGSGTDTVDAQFVQAPESNTKLNVNAGAGDDSLTLSISEYGPDVVVNFSVDTANRVTSNLGTFVKFEHFDISGGVQNDTILGVASAHGGDGDDLIGGTAGNDQLDGGDGFDTVTYASAATAVQVSLADHQATGAGSDTVLGFEAIVGSRFADMLTGDDGANSLSGGAAADTLTGGAGADTLTGGLGADQFRFVALGDFASGDKLDLITDFSHAERDRIVLSGIDLDSATDGRQGFTFIGSGAFHVGGSAYELRSTLQDDGSYRVEGDTNHDGTADIAFVVVSNSALVASDFML